MRLKDIMTTDIDASSRDSDSPRRGRRTSRAAVAAGLSPDDASASRQADP